MTPRSCTVDLVAGQMSHGTGHYRKTLDDLTGLYADRTAFERLATTNGRDVVYEVTEFRPTEASGDLIFGVTRMAPGTVGEEFFLTRGHIHAKPDRPEIYYGQRGSGLMVMESPEGEVDIVEIRDQTICYVPPYWIHRSVNTGSDDLVMAFCYPSDAGQDYDIIERSRGLRVRIVTDGAGGWTQIENADYVPRGRVDIETLRGRPATRP